MVIPKTTLPIKDSPQIVFIFEPYITRRISFRRACVGWRDVLVESEEVIGVVASFNLREPLPGPARIRCADTRLTLIRKKIDIRAGVALLQCRREIRDPGVAHSLILGAIVKCSDIDHNPTRTMCKRSC